MRPGVIPGHIDGPRGVFLYQRLQQLSDLLAALVPLEEDDGFPAVIADGSEAVVLGGLSGCRDHHLLSLGAPHGPARWKPAEIECTRVIEHIRGSQSVTGVFNRLFF